MNGAVHLTIFTNLELVSENCRKNLGIPINIQCIFFLIVEEFQYKSTLEIPRNLRGTINNSIHRMSCSNLFTKLA